MALRIAADEATRDAGRYQQLARTMQESLLPRVLPAVDGLDLATAYRLGEEEVLGDFCDVVPTPTGWAVFLGDVSGKGAFAARTSALVRYTLRAGAQRASSPAIVLTELDAALHRWFTEADTPGFVTVAYLALRRTETGFAARLCTAGHPAAAVRRADGSVHGLGRASSALGILPRLSLKIDETELGPGDCLVLRSDAVDEAALLAALRADGPLEAILDASPEIRDDRVILTLRVR